MYTNLERGFVLSGELYLTPYGDQCNTTQMYKTIIRKDNFEDHTFCLMLVWKVKPLQTFTVRSVQCDNHFELHKYTKDSCKLLAVYRRYESCDSAAMISKEKVVSSYTYNGFEYTFHSKKSYYIQWGGGDTIVYQYIFTVLLTIYFLLRSVQNFCLGVGGKSDFENLLKVSRPNKSWPYLNALLYLFWQKCVHSLFLYFKIRKFA